MANKRRVVVTGLGMLTPVGNDVITSWQAVLSGKSGITSYTQANECEEIAALLSCKVYAGVKNFNPELFLPAKEIKKFDLFILYGFAAAKQALDDSGLIISEDNAHRVGVAIGSGIGGIGTIERSRDILRDAGPRKISPFFIPGSIVNMAAGIVSINLGLKGPSFSTVSACTTGAHNIGEAARHIMYGDADVMVAGGTEKGSSPLGMAGFCALKAMSTQYNESPEKASRPWDRDRDGFVLGDGAGILILEEYEHAKKRGAKIYAELIGYGLSSDAYHMTAPDGIGAANCMRNALNDAGINPDQVDYINAHGTSTPVGDLIESNAVKSVFGDAAHKLSMSSTKSMTGHLLGATGAVEAAFSILALQNNIVPPTINLDNPSDGCDLDYVPHKAKERKVTIALSNSFGFGGTNASLIFKRI
jgi:3-oxoacyl-[acyl-carrier-protein] synthase II